MECILWCDLPSANMYPGMINSLGVLLACHTTGETLNFNVLEVKRDSFL